MKIYNGNKEWVNYEMAEIRYAYKMERQAKQEIGGTFRLTLQRFPVLEAANSCVEKMDFRVYSEDARKTGYS